MRLILLILLIGVVAYFAMNWRTVTPSSAISSIPRAAQAGPDSEGPGEKVGRAVDWALHQAGKAAEHAAERVQEETSSAASPPPPVNPTQEAIDRKVAPGQEAP